MFKFNKRTIVYSLLILVLIALAGCLFLYKEKQRVAQQNIKGLLATLTKAVNMMEQVKDEMPAELLETHEFLINQIRSKKFKLHQSDSRLKDFIMYHGARTGSIYANPSIKMMAGFWIPVFYHEVGHNYWHTKHPVATFEEFQKYLFESENHSYTITAHAWNIVRKHFPIEKENLSKYEKRLFDLYETETFIYNKMFEGDQVAKEKWIEIIEEDIKVQGEQQALLKK